MNIEERVNKVSHFSNIEYDIVIFILSEKKKIISMNTTQLATATFSSPASITRVCKKLGFIGFNELKYSLKNELEKSESLNSESWELLQYDISKTMKILSDVDYTAINSLISNSKKIFVFGTDWGERSAAEIFIRNFLSIGIYMTLIPSITELRWVLEYITEDDLIIIISYSGNNKDVVNISKIIELRKIKIIGITPLSKNNLAKLSVNRLYYYVTELREDDQKNMLEYNMFTTLHIALDAIFRNYYDN